ncbi:11026_t:CDS:2, partial [Gigaspora margarita]
SQKNPSLAEKISSCGSHNLALQNIHRNIAKRGEVTKERIKNAATIVLYIFKHNELLNSCELTLTYNTTQNQYNDVPRVIASYNIAELRDLCGHALLIGKSRASTDYLVNDDSTEDISMLMNQFIIQVDLVQQITNAHRSSRDPRLEKLVGSIDYLYNDLYDNFHASNQEICQNLVREADFLPILCKIGEVLHNIFTDIPQRIRTIPDYVEPVIANTVFKEKIFIADCHSYSL